MRDVWIQVMCLLFLQAHRETDRFFPTSGVQLQHSNVQYSNVQSSVSPETVMTIITDKTMFLEMTNLACIVWLIYLIYCFQKKTNFHGSLCSSLVREGGGDNRAGIGTRSLSHIIYYRFHERESFLWGNRSGDDWGRPQHLEVCWKNKKIPKSWVLRMTGED
jgi:hypothetical protein